MKGVDTCVLMCVHGADDSGELRLALESLYKQEEVAHDLLLHIDGPISEDLEREINSHVATNTLGKVLVRRSDQSVGLAAGLNILIDYALEEGGYRFFARMDSDDISLSHRFKTQLAFLAENPEIAVVGSGITEIDSSGTYHQTIFAEPEHEALVKSMIKTTPIKHPTAIFRSIVFEKGNRYTSELLVAQDYDLWIRLIDGGFRLGNIPEPLLLFRRGDNFFSRRSRDRARLELQMRVRAIKLLCLSRLNYLFAIGLFIIRLSPQPIAQWAYKYLR